MAERLTWEEIQRNYPDQWVGLTDVEWRGSTVVSAVVRYTGVSGDDLTRMQIRDENLYGCYTNPDNLAPLGIMGAMV